MSPNPIQRNAREPKPELTERQAQVLPPHQVDLTLHPVTQEDVHVPAHVNGADLSREAPADANHGNKRKGGSH